MDGPEVLKGYAAGVRQAAADGEEADGGEQPRDDGRRQQLDERAQLHSTGEVEEAAGKEGGPRDGVEDMHLGLEHQGLSWESRVKR